MPNTAIISRFGAAVRSFRFRLGISQEELAERANLHRTYIAGVERGGRNVTLKSISKLAQALEVPIGELVALGDKRAALPCAARDARKTGMLDILLVEDNPDDVSMTLEAFRRFNIANRIHIVSDGAEALEYLLGDSAPSDQYPQLILLDLQLPKVSGFEVLRRIKRESRTRKIPVIVLAASQDSQDVAESRRLGAETYIVKPVDFCSFGLVTSQLQLQWLLLDPTAATYA